LEVVLVRVCNPQTHHRKTRKEFAGTPAIALAPEWRSPQARSMLYAKNIAVMRIACRMRQYLEPLSLEISPDSLSQGEPAIRQAIGDRIVLK
jgi:hypothetical protein